jgi:peptidoglycan/LPS O-acetylase OafA/YrhL
MKYQSLESFRGVAALIVVLFHSNFVFHGKHPIVAQGEIFVDFFFILSGFVMAYAYSDKIQRGLSFWHFFTLRFGRLYPLHLVLLLVWLPYVLAKGYAFHQLGMGSTDPFVRNNAFTFVSNLLMLNGLGINDGISWNYPAWSISVEFCTYMVFFAFSLFVGQAHRAAKFAAMSMFSYTCLYLLTDKSLLATYDYGALRCMGGFFLGGALVTVIQRVQLSWSMLLASAVELCVVAAAVLLEVNSHESKTIQLATFAMFAVLITVFAVQSQGVISKLLCGKFMLMLGTLSYSIYMLHAIVLAAMANIYQYILKMPATVVPGGSETLTQMSTPYAALINIGALIVIIGLSRISYTHIEQPWRERFRAMANKRLASRATS